MNFMGLDLCHAVPILHNSGDGFLEYFTLHELSAYPDYIHKHKHLIVEKDDKDFGKLRVIYFKDVGYQRKGMNKGFYKDFENGKPYFDIETVKKAYHHLHADHINTLESLKQNFQKSFIDSFVEGTSIFYASW